MPKKRSSYLKLKEKWTKRHQELQHTLVSKHKDSFQWLHRNTTQLAVSGLSSLMLLAAPTNMQLPPPNGHVISQTLDSENKPQQLVATLSELLPKEVRSLHDDEEKKLAETLTMKFGIPVAVSLDGKRLNRSYGYIGQEQHLARFPGDTIGSHFDSDDDVHRYYKYGMAPGLGAYRYFASSKDTMTAEENDREKYYIAVQTFLAPGFTENTREMYEFFRFRKMLVVNPENGKAVVVVIGDAGPAEWTGKHLGGSPEVMQYLERVDGAGKGPVLYFFIDDTKSNPKLGPINIVQ